MSGQPMVEYAVSYLAAPSTAVVVFTAELCIAHRLSGDDPLHGHGLRLAVEAVVHGDSSEHASQVAPALIAETLSELWSAWGRATVLHRRDDLAGALRVVNLPGLRTVPWEPTLERIARHLVVTAAGQLAEDGAANFIRCDWTASGQHHGVIQCDPFNLRRT